MAVYMPLDAKHYTGCCQHPGCHGLTSCCDPRQRPCARRRRHKRLHHPGFHQPRRPSVLAARRTSALTMTRTTSSTMPLLLLSTCSAECSDWLAFGLWTPIVPRTLSLALKNICAGKDTENVAFNDCQWISEVVEDVSMIKNFIMNHNMISSMLVSVDSEGSRCSAMC